MLDEDFKVYLIEVNTNPCLELSSTLLARLIPNMVENALRYYLSLYFYCKKLKLFILLSIFRNFNRFYK